MPSSNPPSQAAPLIPRLEPRRLSRLSPGNSLPYPDTPPLPPPPPLPSSCQDLERRIITQGDLAIFTSSATHSLVLAFVFGLAGAATSTTCSAVRDDELSDAVRAIITVLDLDATALLDVTPPSENSSGSRFGNPAFRPFRRHVEDRAAEWTLSIATKAGVFLDDGPATEAGRYLTHAFGDLSRLDYGSGHELNMVLWLLCLYQLRVLVPSDFCALALRVFPRYLVLVRAVQAAYYLEPAGSHGVWGLDDYQFLPFLIGAAQLIDHPFITPLAVHSDATLEQFSPDYLYLAQIAFVNSTKTVRGLRWHSPMLDDISSAKSWAKVEGGMRRMFVTSVLGKLPIMQHFLFGSLIPAPEGLSTDQRENRASNTRFSSPHEHLDWGGCCGIRLPSTLAASVEAKKRGAPESLRRIPFD